MRINYGDTGVIGFMLLTALVLILAYLTYRFIELPFRKKQNTMFRGLSLGLLVTLSIFLFSFGLFGHFTNGIESRLTPEDQTFYRTLERSSEANCSIPLSECVLKASQTPSVLLLGDSNAYHFSRSLREISKSIGLNYFQLTMDGCLPLADFYRLDQSIKFNRDCLDFNSTIRDAIFENEKLIEVIVVSAAWLFYLEGREYFKNQVLAKGVPQLSTVQLSRERGVDLSKSEKVESFDNYIYNMLSLLASRSKKLIIVEPLPPPPC
jgi:hypothetical protein